MDMENNIRERHKREDQIKAFFAQVKNYKDNALFLTPRELELAMGRAYDRMRDATEDSKRFDMLLKGHLLRSVFDARNAGARHSGWRGFLGISDNRFVPRVSGKVTDPIEPFLDFYFDYPLPITEELAAAWAEHAGSSPQRPLADGRK